MYHDICIPYTSSQSDLQRTLSFLVELSYSVAAISFPVQSAQRTSNKGDPTIPQLPKPPTGLKPLLTRINLPLLTNSDLPNAKLQALQQKYDLVALRPTSEKTLLLATSAPEVDLISLDLSARWSFHFRPKMFSAAVKRGVWFEICYSPAVEFPGPKSGKSSSGSGDLVPAVDAATARRNVIANATSLIRALRGGKNVVFSSEAKSILGLRAPLDVVNFGVMLGLSAEKGLEAVRDGPALVVRAAQARRQGWRGVLLDVKIKSDTTEKTENVSGRGVKRKNLVDEDVGAESEEKAKDIKPEEQQGGEATAKDNTMSKRQMKKLARRERQQKLTKDVDGKG